MSVVSRKASEGGSLVVSFKQVSRRAYHIQLLMRLSLSLSLSPLPFCEWLR